MIGLFDGPLPPQRSSLYESMRRPRGDRFDVHCSRARAHCEDLWTDFRAFADQNFKTEFACCTHARWFEMYLTVSLIRAGHEITCPKPGPDILLEADGCRVWIEATSATRGELGRPDSVPLRERGRVLREPTNQYVLRIRNALDEKQRKYRKYVENGVVHERDVTVVAINVFEVDGIGPYVGDHFRRSLYGLGDPVIQINRDSGTVSGGGNTTVVAVQKASGADVGVEPLIDGSLEHIAAVLGSFADPFNRPSRLGDDLILYPNLMSEVPWPQRFLRVGRAWCFGEIEGGWKGTLVQV